MQIVLIIQRQRMVICNTHGIVVCCVINSHDIRTEALLSGFQAPQVLDSVQIRNPFDLKKIKYVKFL